MNREAFNQLKAIVDDGVSQGLAGYELRSFMLEKIVAGEEVNVNEALSLIEKLWGYL